MNLYFVSARSNDGESLDWFVNAGTPEKALELWFEFQERNFECDREDIPSPNAVFAVPLPGVSEGVLHWFEPGGVPCVIDLPERAEEDIGPGSSD